MPGMGTLTVTRSLRMPTNRTVYRGRKMTTFAYPAVPPALTPATTLAVPAGVTTDLDGNPRIVMVETATVDMGAYEFQGGTPIPTVPAWSVAAMSLLLLTTGTLVHLKRRRGTV